jgi:hypothetical protein
MCRPLFKLQAGVGRMGTHITVKREIIRFFETLTVLPIYIRDAINRN